MKIKIKQLDERTRLTIANALLEYYPNIAEYLVETPGGTHELSARIASGELLLCEYINTDAEKGGNHGL